MIAESWTATSAKTDGGIRKRIEATKAQPRTEDGSKLASGVPTTSGETRDRKTERERETATAKAAASHTNRGAVERMDALAGAARH